MTMRCQRFSDKSYGIYYEGEPNKIGESFHNKDPITDWAYFLAKSLSADMFIDQITNQRYE